MVTHVQWDILLQGAASWQYIPGNPHDHDIVLTNMYSAVLCVSLKIQSIYLRKMTKSFPSAVVALALVIFHI